MSNEDRTIMAINIAQDIFNHMSEEVLQQICKERYIKLTSQLKPYPGRLYVKGKKTNLESI